jgi:peptidoglycan/LPS O-acetylase OafA/YrhL
MEKTMSIPTRLSKGNSFNALRLLLSILVVIQHSAFTSGHYFTFSSGIISLGTLAVIGFFAISGFLVAPGIMHGGFVRYLFRRSARILPAFWCLNIMTVLFFVKIWQGWSRNTRNISISDTCSYLFHNIIFFPASPESPSAGWNLLKGLPVDVPRSGVVNESIWTLPLEFVCYIALGIFVVTLTRFFLIRFEQLFLLVLFIFWLVSIYFSTVMPNFWEPNPTLFTTVFGKWPYFISFFIGSALSLRSHSFSSSRFTWFIPLLLVIAFLSSYKTLMWALFGSTAFAMAIIFLGSSNILSKLPKKIDISYGIYLYHWPVQQTLVHFYSEQRDRLLFILISLLVSATLAYISAILIEQPALKYARKLQFKK